MNSQKSASRRPKVVAFSDFRLLDLRLSTVVTWGTFDGVHLGHRALLKRVRELATERGLKSAVLTFTRPPQNYLGWPKKLILPIEKKLELLQSEVDDVVTVEFPDVQMLAPDAFIKSILRERLKAAVIVVGNGEALRFGHNRRGDLNTLKKLASELELEVEVIPPFVIDGKPVSSTAVRELIKAGAVEQAARLLGYPPLLCGVVIQGTGRGRRLGFPTANLQISEELATPDEGVFAVRVSFKKQTKEGVLYIGRRPTFDGKDRSFEVHILNTSEELYGEYLEVSLLKRLRGDEHFSDPAALLKQIKADIQAAEALFK